MHQEPGDSDNIQLSKKHDDNDLLTFLPLTVNLTSSLELLKCLLTTDQLNQNLQAVAWGPVIFSPLVILMWNLVWETLAQAVIL